MKSYLYIFLKNEATEKQTKIAKKRIFPTCTLIYKLLINDISNETLSNLAHFPNPNVK